MNAAIRTEKLTKSYKDKKKKFVSALKNLSLEIQSGETFGFIGPNGAGKTTAIKILTGLAFPTSGRAFLFDQPVYLPSSRRRMGYLSEVAAYSPYFDAEEILLATSAIHEIDRAKAAKKCADLLKLVGLDKRKNSRLGEFSKGMLQRLGIAQSLVNDPQLLILDEPTSGLDPIGQREMLTILHSLKKRGITIFFSSHRLAEVEGLCDHVAIINLGELIFQGTITQLEKQDVETPFLIRYKKVFQKGAVLNFPNIASRTLDENLFEITVEQKALDRSLHHLQEAGVTIMSVSPQRSPLEDIFIHMISQHKGSSLP